MKKKLTRYAQSSSPLFAWVICALTALFYTYEYLLRIEPSLMIYQLRVYFSLSAAGVGLLASMYYWAYTPLQLIVGLVTDRFGARRVLISAIGACVIGSLAFGLTRSYLVAEAARFLIGAGSAFAFVGALKLGADWLPKKYFSLFVGLCTALGMLGAMFGETTMSYVVDHLGWHPVIIDSVWLGIILITLFSSLVYEKHELVDSHKRSKKITFSSLQRSLKKIIASPIMLQTGFIGCAMFLSLSLFAEQWGNIFIQRLLNSDEQSASYYVDLIFLGWLIGSPFFGFLSEKLESRRQVLFGGSLLSLIIFLPLVLFPLKLSLTQLAIILFLFAFFNSAQINCFALAHDVIENESTATAIGFMNACVMLGGMIIQPLFGFLLDYFASPYHSIAHHLRYALKDYQHALWIIPIFLLLSTITSYRMKETYVKS